MSEQSPERRDGEAAETAVPLTYEPPAILALGSLGDLTAGSMYFYFGDGGGSYFF